jgi:hypothetical protein
VAGGASKWSPRGNSAQARRPRYFSARAVAHEQAVAQRRAAEGVSWRRRKARIVRQRLRLASKDHGGVLRATLTHKSQVEDVAVALALSGEEGVSVLDEW